ncbi:MAG: glycosyltransferase, partial [Rhodospirillales bacterium]|nr:glycosyltransferase [Acetobacter sp.]
MNIVVFGLAVSSSWGNGHAALWRGLIRALHADGHHVTFFERDVPYYAEHRDLTQLPGGGKLILYRDWNEADALAALRQADVAMVTSYCPDAAAATRLVVEAAGGLRCFYDLDTPVTLTDLAAGRPVPHAGSDGYRNFDLVLSYTGGKAVDLLQTQLGARHVVPLYGWVDPELYQPAPAAADRADLSYLGTYAPDRQPVLDRLLIEPARRAPDRRFVIGGAMYPQDFPWTRNIWFRRHVPPPAHPAFYAASRMTLNVTRAAMADMGWCPSGRLFEAAACGVPILSDSWAGLDAF